LPVIRRLPRVSLVALAAVAGPGLLAGLSDDDPAGITTYSILGTEYGYSLLWVLALSTGALIAFHELGARMGVVTGRGLMTLVRDRFGGRRTALALAALVTANVGTTCAELAGVAAALELAHVSRYISVPVAAVLVSWLVLRESFHRLEHVLLAVSAIFAAYVLSGILAHPDWSAAARGLVVPTVAIDRHASLIIAATVGTTLAPWGLAFLQSYAVDKRLSRRDLPLERVDVVVGAVATGVIGLFVVVACAATLHANGEHISDAGDAAAALRPLAGGLAAALFGAGLLGAALLAAAILPLSTAYSVSEAFGAEAKLDDHFRQAPTFYLSFFAVIGIASALVLVPGAPLVRILFLTQALNAVLLLPLLALMLVLARDRSLLGEDTSSGGWWAAEIASFGLVALSVGLLAVLAVIR
jgi:Mn2+/Fe2+ NRAMP family transporter